MLILNKTSLFTNINTKSMNISFYYIFICRNILKDMMNDEILVEECVNSIIANWHNFKKHIAGNL